MSPLMHNPPFSREPVLHPLLLNVDQPALPRTKQQMLKRGKLEKVVFGVWCAIYHLMVL
jgi:hypothetical protein